MLIKGFSSLCGFLLSVAYEGGKKKPTSKEQLLAVLAALSAEQPFIQGEELQIQLTEGKSCSHILQDLQWCLASKVCQTAVLLKEPGKLLLTSGVPPKCCCVLGSSHC